jgi:hypothetical protein
MYSSSIASRHLANRFRASLRCSFIGRPFRGVVTYTITSLWRGRLFSPIAISHASIFSTHTGDAHSPKTCYQRDSTLLTYVLRQGVKQGIVGADYNREIAAAMDSLKCHTRANGTVDFAQGDRMNLSNPSTRYEPAPYAQGMVLAVFVTEGAR